MKTTTEYLNKNRAGQRPLNRNISIWKTRIKTLVVILALLAAFLPGKPAFALVIKSKNDASSTAGAEHLAEVQKSIRERTIGHYGMVPIYARDIADGIYDMEVESSSPFFKITEATLVVEGEEMRADITIGSKSYLYVYMGTAEEAENAPEKDWIEAQETRRATVFSIPVPALNTEFECASFSKRRQRWYDRQLLLDAAMLPEGTLDFELPDYKLAEAAIRAYTVEGLEEIQEEETEETAGFIPEAVPISRSDGEYSIEVNMAGGSGRANVSSPTLLIVRDGKAYARLLWSSPYYDYMVIGDEIFDNLTTDGGNSTFEIPITVMDEPMDIIADTTAMGDPVEIEYTLTFYSESLGDKSQIPQEAAKKVLMISAAIILTGAILNYFVKKKRKG